MAEGMEVLVVAVMVAFLVEVGVRIFDLLQESSAQDLLLPVAEAEYIGHVVPMAVTQDIRPANQLQDFLDVLVVFPLLLLVEGPNQLEVQVVLVIMTLEKKVLLELAVMVTHFAQEAVEADITEEVEVVKVQLVVADRHTVMEEYVLVRHILMLLFLEMELLQYHISSKFLQVQRRQ
jgi:hypothetical protein